MKTAFMIMGLIAVGVGVNVAPTYGQVKEVGSTCEEVTLALDFAGGKFEHETDPNRRFIIIATSNSAKYQNNDLSRIKQAIGYLSRLKKVEAGKIDYGTRLERSKYSHMRFYVGGKVVAEIRAHPRGKLCDGLNDLL
jgi:hypothetical protein